MYLRNNKNIIVDSKTRSVEFQPYNREITLDFLRYWLKILPHYIPSDYAVLLHGFNFDGLGETNISLIVNGGQIIDNYTGNYRSI